jgi:hypothetical protein
VTNISSTTFINGLFLSYQPVVPVTFFLRIPPASIFSTFRIIAYDYKTHIKYPVNKIVQCHHSHSPSVAHAKVNHVASIEQLLEADNAMSCFLHSLRSAKSTPCTRCSLSKRSMEPALERRSGQVFTSARRPWRGAFGILGFINFSRKGNVTND